MNACVHAHTTFSISLFRERIPFLNLTKPGKDIKGFSSFALSVCCITDASVSLNKTTGFIRIHTYFQCITFYTLIEILYNMDFFG